MKTIAQQINWDFEANGTLEILDKNGKEIYSENSGGYWSKWKHDSKGNEIYNESSDGGWTKFEYDSKGNRIYFEDSNGNKAKWEYDSKSKEIYYEDSNGLIEDNRPKPCEDKVVEIDGVKFKLVKVSGGGFFEKTKNKTSRSRNIFREPYGWITKLFTHPDKY